MTDDDKTMRAQAWDFFTIVAAQRLTVINFYIALATLLASGQLALLQSPQYRKAGAALGCLLAVLSIIFWKWDKRSSDLIKLAENTLKYYESRIEIADTSPDAEVAFLFTYEEKYTNNKKDAAHLLNRYFTYRTCLNLTYCMFAGLGIVVAFICILK